MAFFADAQLTWIFCIDSRKVSSQFQKGLIFIVSMLIHEFGSKSIYEIEIAFWQ